MASSKSHDHSECQIERACCKCSKSDGKMNKQQCSPYIENAMYKFEERRGDLVNRQQYLKQKITTLERSIPALIAFNMLKTGENCELSPLCKVKQMMNNLTSHPDPTDKLLDKLENTVKILNGETAELHDKIITADIKLEESEMELESIELANKEFEDRLKNLENELKRHETPSLHSIHSDDLICLSKIRQLGEAEVNLKNCIKELEEREYLFHRQMDRIFKSNEFKKTSCGGITKKNHQLQCNERRMHCALQIQKCNVQQLKKKLGRNEKEHDSLTTCVSPTSPLTACPDDSSSRATSRSDTLTKTQSPSNDLPYHHNCTRTHSKCLQPSASSLKSYCASTVSTSRKQACISTCKESSNHLNPSYKIANNCSAVKPKPGKEKTSYNDPSNSNGKPVTPFASRLKTVAFTGSPRITDSSKRQTLPSSNLDTSCQKCQGFKRNLIACRCSCMGMCATGQSGISCNCVEYLNLVDQEDNQEIGDSTKINYQSSTDDEYCECCDCNCEDSDLSDKFEC